MAQEELSKRIDDVHRRLDDLKADGLQLRQDTAAGFAQLRQEILQLRQDMKEGDTALRQEILQLRQDIHHDLNRRFGQLFWQMNIWFALLALLTTVYRFLR